MFGFRWKHRTIIVDVFQPGEAKRLLRTVIPTDELPDTFEIKTKLNIQGEEWEVAEAWPPTKEEFRLKGYLQVAVYKPRTERLPINELLYSLPTISDDIAPLENSLSLENVFVVHEDDWRQQELVSRGFTDDISKEIESILQIFETQRVEFGFKKIHVRSSIPSPLRNVRLTLPDLKSRLGTAHDYRGAAFNHVAGVIQNGFAFQSDEGSTFWGQRRDNDELAVVCVRLPAPDSHNRHRAASMDALLSDYNLVFVDWVNLMVIPPIDSGIV